MYLSKIKILSENRSHALRISGGDNYSHCVAWGEHAEILNFGKMLNVLCVDATEKDENSMNQKFMSR